MNNIIVEPYTLGTKYLIAFVVQTMKDPQHHLNYVTIILDVNSVRMKNSEKISTVHMRQRCSAEA